MQALPLGLWHGCHNALPRWLRRYSLLRAWGRLVAYRIVLIVADVARAFARSPTAPTERHCRRRDAHRASLLLFAAGKQAGQREAAQNTFAVSSAREAAGNARRMWQPQRLRRRARDPDAGRDDRAGQRGRAAGASIVVEHQHAGGGAHPGQRGGAGHARADVADTAARARALRRVPVTRGRVVLDCGHYCLCGDCVRALGRAGYATCPICCTRVRDVRRVYM